MYRKQIGGEGRFKKNIKMDGSLGHHYTSMYQIKE